MQRHRAIFCGLCAVILMALTAQAQAHTRSESFSRWSWSGKELGLVYTVSARETTRLPGFSSSGSPAQALARYLSETLAVEGGGCQVWQTPVIVPSQAAYARVSAAWRCETLPERLHLAAFFELAPEHSHFATLETDNGNWQQFLGADLTYWQLDSSFMSTLNSDETQARNRSSQRTQAAAPSGVSFWAYLQLGFNHILSGLDHLLFLLGLVLICNSPREWVIAISGFTFGHSLTLSLAVLQIVQPNVAAIEASIGLTIALIAVERSSRDHSSATLLATITAAVLLLGIALPWLAGILSDSAPVFSVLFPMSTVLSTTTFTGLALFSFCYLMLSPRLANHSSYRLLITCLFGLIHGFGFAGGFMAAQFEVDSLLLPLAGFNAGVELGQLGAVAVLVSLAYGWRSFCTRFPLTRIPAADVLSAVVCGFGVFWFVQRAWG